MTPDVAARVAEHRDSMNEILAVAGRTTDVHGYDVSEARTPGKVATLTIRVTNRWGRNRTREAVGALASADLFDIRVVRSQRPHL
jgi:hypothetical protein